MRSGVQASTNFPSVKSTEKMGILDAEELDLNLPDSFLFEESCDAFSLEPFLE